MADPALISGRPKETTFEDADSFVFSDVSSGLDKRIEGSDLRQTLNIAVISNLDDLREFEGKRDGQIAQLLGTTTEGDGGNGKVYWDATSTEDDDKGTIFKVTGVDTGRWKRFIRISVKVDWFETPADAFAYLASDTRTRIDFTPEGEYEISDRISVFNIDNIVVNGNGAKINQSAIANDLSWLLIQGTRTTQVTTVSSDVAEGDSTIPVADSSSFSVDDYIAIRSDGEVFNAESTNEMKSEWLQVESVPDSTSITVYGKLRDTYDATSHTVYIDSLDPVKNITVRDLEIIGAGTDTALDRQIGIRISNFVNATYENVTSTDNGLYGLDFTSGWDADAINCHVTGTNVDGNGYGIHFQGIEGGTATNNHIRHCRHGIDTRTFTPAPITRNIEIAHNNIKYCTAAGLSSHAGSSNIKWLYNIVEDCKGGGNVRGEKHHIEGNDFIWSDISGASVPQLVGLSISASDSNTGLSGTGLKVIRNTITGSTDGIVSFAPLKDAEFYGNDISGISRTALRITGVEHDNVRINNNTFDVTLTDNEFFGNAIEFNQGGSSLTSSGSQVIRNVWITNNTFKNDSNSGQTDPVVDMIRIRVKNSSEWNENFHIYHNTVEGVRDSNGSFVHIVGVATAGEGTLRNMFVKNNICPEYPIDNIVNITNDPTTEDVFYSSNISSDGGFSEALVGNAAPISGTWTRGDRVINEEPSASGNVGWVCVSSGSPGTWKEYGTIEA